MANSIQETYSLGEHLADLENTLAARATYPSRESLSPSALRSPGMAG